MALRLRRGTDTQRQLVTPLDGELVYTTDTKKLYVGDGTTAGGNAVDTAGTNLGSNLDLSGFNITGTGNVQVDGNITATGNLTVDGNFTLGGNITVGDASTDTINFAAKIESSLIPDVSGARNVGSPSNKFGTVYADFLSVSDSIEATSLNANIIGNDSTVLLNVATGAVNVSGTLKGNVNASDNTSFFNATSKAVNAGAATFTGAVSAASVTSTFDGDLSGSVYADDSTTIVDGVAGTVKLHNGEISISSTGVLTAQNSVFQISSPNEVTNTELRIYHGTGGNFGAQKFFSLAGSDSLDPGGIAFRGYKGGFEGSGNETKLAAGDYVGQITSQAFDPDFGGGTSILSSQIAFRLDPDETIADDTAKGQIEFINNSGTGTNLTVVTMVFDASGRLGVNKTNPTSNLDVTGTAAVSSTMQLGAMSTATRDALVGTANGMVIYNTTTNKFQGYAAGAWVDLH